MRGLTVWIGALGFAFGAFASAAGPASAQGQPSASEIVDALKPQTRGIGAAMNPTNQRFIDDLRNKPTRSITIEERTKAAEIATAKPSVDLEVTFDFDSSEIGSKAMPTLVTLGKALRDPQLKDQLFLVGGHTDAKGGDAHNQVLSELRAEAVKNFLVEKFSLPPANLISIGFGKEQLKNKGDPFADENRRVQVVNLSAQ
jgi:outer membrane protein OmpA-like peptidoglycan-associated protein